MRKNLLYVDWNEEINNWNIELIKNENVEYFDIIEELAREKDRDTSLDSIWERELERSEEETERQLEDGDLKVKT